MEPFTIEMPGSDRLWTVTFTDRGNTEFIADARSGEDMRRSRWRLSPSVADQLWELELLVKPESRPAWFPADLYEPDARTRWLLWGVVRIYRLRLDEIVATDGSDYTVEDLDELIGPRGSGYLEQIEREITDVLFVIPFDAPQLSSMLPIDNIVTLDQLVVFPRLGLWKVAAPALRDATDPYVADVVPALAEFYDKYESVAAVFDLPPPVNDSMELLRRLREVNALGCRALRKLAATRPLPHPQPRDGATDRPLRAWWLREITLERFKAAFAPAPVELRPFTVIIGRNGSGKSTLLEALQWLDTALRRDIVEASARYYGLSHLIHRRGRQAAPWFQLALSWDAQDDQDDNALDYIVRVAEPKNVPRVENEHLTPRSRDKSTTPRTPLIFRQSAGLRPQLLQLRDQDLLHDFWDRAVFLRLSPSRLAQASPPRRKSFDPLLDEEGQSLPTLLAELNDDQRADLIAALDDVLSFDIDGLDLSSAGPGEALFYSLSERVTLPGKDAERLEIPSWMLSEGTRRLTALFALLCRDPAPSLLCIEEIENGLDPWTVGAVLKHLQSAVRRGTQVIVTTHSPWLLDQVPLDCILQARRTGGDIRYERFASRPEVKAYADSIPPGTRYVNELE